MTTDSQREMVTLPDGTRVGVRPIVREDAPRLQALYARLSPQSRYWRFLGHASELTARQAEQLATLDGDKRMALAATEENDDTCIIAVARYALLETDEEGVADFAIAVQDDYQGRGVGTVVLMRLADWARARGIHTFSATMHYENIRMMRFLQHSELPMETVRMCQGQRTVYLKLVEQNPRATD